MGKLVNTGRNIVASDFISRHTWWVVLGRCNFTDQQGVPTNEYPWAVEVTPDDEVVADTWPDTDMGADDALVGIHRATSVQLVKPDGAGSITVNGTTYSLTTDEQYSHIYWKFDIDPEDFVGDPDPNNPLLFLDNLAGYRRISLRADLVPNASELNRLAIRGAHVEAANRGKLFYYSNEVLRQRPVPPVVLNERHVIKIVLQPSMIV